VNDNTDDHVDVNSPADNTRNESEPRIFHEDVQNGVGNSSCREHLKDDMSQSCVRIREAEEASDGEKRQNVLDIVQVGPII
jgi:hypothetical protein